MRSIALCTLLPLPRARGGIWPHCVCLSLSLSAPHSAASACQRQRELLLRLLCNACSQLCVLLLLLLHCVRIAVRLLTAPRSRSLSLSLSLCLASLSLCLSLPPLMSRVLASSRQLLARAAASRVTINAVPRRALSLRAATARVVRSSGVSRIGALTTHSMQRTDVRHLNLHEYQSKALMAKYNVTNQHTAAMCAGKWSSDAAIGGRKIV